MYITNRYVSHTQTERKRKIATPFDFDALSFVPLNIVGAVEAHAVAEGCKPGLARNVGWYVALITAVHRYTGHNYYQAAQEKLAELVCRFQCRTKTFDRSYLNRVAMAAQRLGFIDIPDHKTNPESPPKIHGIGQTLMEMLGTHRVTGSSTTLNIDHRGHACARERRAEPPERKVAKATPERRPVRELFKLPWSKPKPTIGDRNHLKALRRTIPCLEGGMTRDEYRLLFHSQSALPNAYVALRFFVRAVGDEDWMKRFGRLRKGSRSGAVLSRNDTAVMEPRELTVQDKQLLYWILHVTRNLKEGIVRLVEIIERRRDGDEHVYGFLRNWSEFGQCSKRGHVRDLLSTCAREGPGEVTATVSDPTIELSERELTPEKSALLESLHSDAGYTGYGEDLWRRFRATDDWEEKTAIIAEIMGE